ncbi:PTS glucitol/sorbitol transporter subunit IIC [Nitratireductor sp. ZSWI3]|nr:PTS glucitol/sorbitol transporter subunit IIC [Nitratireductor sp. ZSWI3]MCR4267995.1 PTS glucitol/sorbitol transporter subunit IIC [Nitratireductor sp. ZSWI3]
MAVISLMAQHADTAVQGLHMAGTLAGEAALHGKLAAKSAMHDLVVLAQANGDISVEEFREKLNTVTQEEQLGWLTAAGKYFIGIFQKGGEVFAGFVTGIIPTLVVLMTAFYAVTELVGEQRVHGLAQSAGRIALTRYTVLPVLAVFFLTNPMAYTFGSFLEEKHKPAFYDAAVSYVHPPLGLFPHINPGEYFVWGGILVALLELERNGTVPGGYHITVAIWYAIVGLGVILLKGMLTERITAIMARRQGVEL